MTDDAFVVTQYLARTPDGERDVLDLRRAVADLLRAAGVASVATLGPCTRCSPDYCSFRRDGASAGRQASVIGWR